MFRNLASDSRAGRDGNPTERVSTYSHELLPELRASLNARQDTVPTGDRTSVSVSASGAGQINASAAAASAVCSAGIETILVRVLRDVAGIR